MKGHPSSPNNPVVSVANTDRDVMERLSALWASKLLTWHSGKQNNKIVYILKMKGFKAISLMKLISPFMGIRRRGQIHQALASYDPYLKSKSHSKLSNDEITRVRRKLAAGYGVREIAREMSIGHSSISRIKTGISHGCVVEPVPAFYVNLDKESQIDAGGFCWASDDLFWLSGLAEAESSFCKDADNDPNASLFSIGMVDRDVVERVVLMLGVSMLYQPPKMAWWKPIFKCKVHGGRARNVMRLLYPFMGARRQKQIGKVLSDWAPRKRGRRSLDAAKDISSVHAQLRTQSP